MAKKFLDKLSANTFRRLLNLWPPFLGAGIKVLFISEDFREARVCLKFRFYNKNYVNTQFGGSMFAMTDPFYMMILLKNLGKDYIIWDKGGQVNFKKPGTSNLVATFKFIDEELQIIKQQTDTNEKYVFDKPVDILNEAGEVVATVIRTLYVRRKQPEKYHAS